MRVRPLAGLLIGILIPFFGGCGSSPVGPTSERVSAVIVEGTAPHIFNSRQFTATAAFRDGTSRQVTTEATWASSDTTVATVENGVVSGHTVGEAEITARYQNVTGRLRITVSTTPCVFSVSPSAVSSPAAGGMATVNVSTAANCAWTAASSAAFVTITSGASGQGSGAMSISVAANPGSARTAMLTIAGRQVTVSQAAGNCVTSVSPLSADYSAELKRGTVTVTASPGCQWSAATTSPFISLGSVPPSGTGNGSFMYRVLGNLTGMPRTGSIQVAPQSVTVTQRPPLGGNYLSFVSDPGDYIGQGWTVLHEVPTSTLTVTMPTSSRAHVRVNVIGSDGLSTLNWSLDLVATQGQELVPGTYLNATRYPFQAPTVPGLNFSGDGRGCNVLRGAFTITEVTFGTDNSVQRLRATFEQHCEGNGPALRGTVSYVR